MAHLLGIDVGTSGCKAVVMAADGRVLGSATAEYPLLQPRPTWAEQDPTAWWEGVCTAVPAALARAGVDGREVSGIGLTGQMHGAVALDAADAPVRPALIWCDQRSAAEADGLERRLGTRIKELVANPALPNFTATKLLWLRQHEPAHYARIRRVLLPKDYVRLRLTGASSTDVSDASGTLAFDVARRTWSGSMCELLEIPVEWWPAAAESPTVTATVSAAGAEATGLRVGTPVVAGAGDQAASALGTGIAVPGLVSVTVGTSGVVFAATDGVTRDPGGRLHTFCHAVPGTWHVMGVTQAAGGSLQWWRDAFAQDERSVAAETGEDVYAIICGEAASVPPGAEGLTFLPYLMGERTPHTDPLARGVFFGITPRHRRAHFARAILEGVAQSLRDCLELIGELGCPLREVRVTGGGGRSPVWRQILADVFARPLRAVGGSEGPATGAALLAAVGTGAYATVAEACAAAVSPGETCRPATDAVAAYVEQREVYTALYPALRPVFAAAGGPGK